MATVTPFHSSVGGLLLGAASAAKLALTGRVLGVSGALRAISRGDFEPWRLSFIGGMAGSGLLASYFYTSAFQPLPHSFSRAAMSGLLIGLGSSLGNGCTSGHGICGNSRLSLRSFVYTCVFMISGMVAATLTKTAEALGVTGRAEIAIPSSSFMQSTSVFTILSIVALILPFLLHKKQSMVCCGLHSDSNMCFSEKKGDSKEKKNGFLDCVAEFVCGGIFGSALCLSGMTLPSKVAAFLSPLHPGFDPSLMFVMGAALLVATPAFYFILRDERTRMKAPVCADNFQVPTSKHVDSKLLTGGVLFGAGWGLGGICPGPALVSFTQPSVKLAVYFAFLLVGFTLDSPAVKSFFAQKDLSATRS